MASKTYKLDVFKVLDHIAKRDLAFWDTLTEEDIKGFQPVVVQQWLSGVTDAWQVFQINSLVNTLVFQLGQHNKQLLYQLMCCAVNTKKHNWIKRKPLSNYPKALKVLSEYTGDAKRICKGYLNTYTNEDILTMCGELGYQKPDIALVKKELKKRD